MLILTSTSHACGDGFLHNKDSNTFSKEKQEGKGHRVHDSAAKFSSAWG